MSAAAAANAAAVRPALESARAGKFDEAMQALKGTADDQLAAVFLKGLVLLSSGDLKGAAGKIQGRAAHGLRVLSRPRSTSARATRRAARIATRPARGRPSLITESNAPFVYTLLGDALLRLRDMDQAIDVLTEARDAVARRRRGRAAARRPRSSWRTSRPTR